jgi:hypothetical protein
MSDPAPPLKRQRSEPLAEEPPSSRRKLPMSSEPEADASGDADQMMVDADDAAHARLDEAVLKICPFEPSIIELGTFLLATIVSTSEGQLDPQYEKIPNARALLEEHPELMDKLKEAWVKGTFREIRNLSAISTFQRKLDDS